MPRAVPHTRYDYKSGTTTKDWLGQAREDAVADSAVGIPPLASAAVDLNEGTGAKQPLYTVPASKIAIITLIVVRSFSTDATTAIVDAGFNAGATDWLSPSAELIAGSTRAVVLPAGDGATGAAAEVFGLVVTTPEGSALTATVDVFGYLIAA